MLPSLKQHVFVIIIGFYVRLKAELINILKQNKMSEILNLLQEAINQNGDYAPLFLKALEDQQLLQNENVIICFFFRHITKLAI